MPVDRHVFPLPDLLLLAVMGRQPVSSPNPVEARDFGCPQRGLGSPTLGRERSGEREGPSYWAGVAQSVAMETWELTLIKGQTPSWDNYGNYDSNILTIWPHPRCMRPATLPGLPGGLASHGRQSLG